MHMSLYLWVTNSKPLCIYGYFWLPGYHIDTTFINMNETSKAFAEGHDHPL